MNWFCLSQCTNSGLLYIRHISVSFDDFWYMICSLCKY